MHDFHVSLKSTMNRGL
jgi:hypothetical protein